jgi:hemerythrin HHE cation binding domain-containing protein
MLEKLLLSDNHAIAILMKDHDKVKDLFDRFENSESPAEKEKIIAEAVTELKIHAAVEEDIFYPAVRKHVGKDLMNEADEEHHVARVLIAELDRDGRRDDHREAKFTVLAESVRHHIKEEEGEMLPKAKGLEIDFEALGEQMLARKKELQTNGIPDDAEHAMVAAVNGKDDTPAAASQRVKPAIKSVPQRSTTRKKTAREKPSSSPRSRRASKSRSAIKK